MNLPLDMDALFVEMPVAELDKMFPAMSKEEIRLRRKRARRAHAERQHRSRYRTLGFGIGREAAGLFYEPRIVPPTEPVYRDPCPRCGVRGDVPCGHDRTRLGTIL